MKSSRSVEHLWKSVRRKRCIFIIMYFIILFLMIVRFILQRPIHFYNLLISYSCDVIIMSSGIQLGLTKGLRIKFIFLFLFVNLQGAINAHSCKQTMVHLLKAVDLPKVNIRSLVSTMGFELMSPDSHPTQCTFRPPTHVHYSC